MDCLQNLSKMKSDIKNKRESFDSTGNTNYAHAFQAARTGNIAYLSNLDSQALQRVMRRPNDGSTLSHVAAEYGRVQVLIFLRERGCNVAGATDAFGWKPIHVASFYGQLKCVQLLATPQFSKFISVDGVGFEDITDIDVKDDCGYAPITWAAANGNFEVVAFLRERGSNCNIKNKYGLSPLDVAWKNLDAGGWKVLQALEESSVGSLSDCSTSNLTAAAARKATFEEKLREMYNWHSPSGSIKAAREGNLAWLIRRYPRNQRLSTAMLVQNPSNRPVGAPIEQPNPLNNPSIVALPNGWTMQHAAAQGGHLHILRFLFQSNCNMSVQDDHERTPLHVAALEGNNRVIILLCTVFMQPANPAGNRRRATPLHCAALMGNYNACFSLLSACGGDITAADKNGNTILHYCAKQRNLRIAELLLSYGAPKTATNHKGRTPLHTAAANGRASICDAFCKANENSEGGPKNYGGLALRSPPADVNKQDYAGDTPAHLAASNGHKDVLEVLRDHKAWMDLPNFKGWTPLHFAVLNGHEKVIRLLGEKFGVLLARLTEALESPMLFACSYGHVNAVRMLASLGVRPNGISPTGDMINEDFIQCLMGAARSGYDAIISVLCMELKFVDPSSVAYGNIVVSYDPRKKYTRSQYMQNSDPATATTTAMHEAASNDRASTIILLASLGVAVDSIECADRCTPLHHAARAGCLQAVKALLRTGGADPSRRDPSNNTPMKLARIRGHVNICQFLFLYSKQNNRGDAVEVVASALPVAARRKDFACLLKWKAKVCPGISGEEHRYMYPRRRKKKLINA